MLCKHCSAIAKALVCYQHCFSNKSEVQHHASCYEENKPSTTTDKYYKQGVLCSFRNVIAKASHSSEEYRLNHTWLVLPRYGQAALCQFNTGEPHLAYTETGSGVLL